ncbi:lipoprotein [Streptomyces sp. NPDC051211]|uniref:lipoprotein n=1 Tax=Streptomyces sp. NPDC051211 TaxID=3154643 RepID=UPI00344DD318
MRGLMRMAVAMGGAVVVMGGLVGCEGADAGGKAKASAAPTAAPSAAAPGSGVKAAGSVGADGSGCRLPVVFDLAEDWKPKTVARNDDERFASLFEQGGLTLTCEIDAKPAGNIGFLRVWTADKAKGNARQVLEAFMAGEKPTGTPAYTEVPAGALQGVEAAYETTALDESKKEHAYAVVTPGGAAVVLQLGGLDTQEHDEMLPAYRLARQSLKAAR